MRCFVLLNRTSQKTKKGARRSAWERLSNNAGALPSNIPCPTDIKGFVLCFILNCIIQLKTWIASATEFASEGLFLRKEYACEFMKKRIIEIRAFIFNFIKYKLSYARNWFENDIVKRVAKCDNCSSIYGKLFVDILNLNYFRSVVQPDKDCPKNKWHKDNVNHLVYRVAMV